MGSKRRADESAESHATVVWPDDGSDAEFDQALEIAEDEAARWSGLLDRLAQ